MSKLRPALQTPVIEPLEPRRLLSTGSLAGVIFNDANGDGTHQRAEPGLSGWTVFLDLNSNGKLDAKEPSTVSRKNGRWILSGLAGGTYSVREVVQNNWRQTAPVSGVIDATLTAGRVTRAPAFGDQRNAAPNLAYFDFDGSPFYAPSLDLIGGTTIVQAGNNVVAGGQAGISGTAAAWDHGVNDDGNSLSLHLDPAKITQLSVSFDYRSTKTSATGISFGPAKIAVKLKVDGAVKVTSITTLSLTRDSAWHPASISLSRIARLSSVKGVTITLLPANGADLGTLSIDDLAVSGVMP